MSDLDVSGGEMFNKNKTDDEIEALVSGRGLDSDSSDVGLFVAALRSEVDATPMRSSDPVLAEFLDVTSLGAADAGPEFDLSRRRKMVSKIGAFVATTTGKVVVCASVAAASVGGGYAADVVDVEDLPGVVSDSESYEKTNTEKGKSENDNGPSDKGNSGSDKDADNHGQDVSDYAKETQLEGCEKGQAISDQASVKADDVRQNEGAKNAPCDNAKENGVDNSATGQERAEEAKENGADNSATGQERAEEAKENGADNSATGQERAEEAKETGTQNGQQDGYDE